MAFTGNRALGVFGFPQSHEHDARRAARFALDVHQAVSLQSHSLRARLGLELRVSGGLHTGLVTLRGDEVSADQVAGLVLAEAIDLADEAKPGEILVSAASELPVRRDLDFQAAGEVTLATSGQKWPVFRLIGERDAFAAFTTSVEKAALLGRAAELHRVNQQFQRATSEKSGRSLWLEGEPGVGKSYLVEHFRSVLAPSGGRWLHVRCLPEARQVALYPVLQLVRQQLGLADLQPEAAVAQLEQQLDRLGLDLESASSASLLCPWLQLPMNDPRPPRFAPQRMREMSIELLAEVVVKLLGDEPAVFAVEDAHWCDATTREWLGVLRTALKSRPVLMLTTTRPGFDAPVKAACAPDDEIQLRGLEAEDSEALILRLAGDHSIEPALAAEMVKRADGVPLFPRRAHALRDQPSHRQRRKYRDTAQLARVVERAFGSAGSRQGDGAGGGGNWARV